MSIKRLAVYNIVVFGLGVGYHIMNKDAAPGIPWFQLILTLILFNVGAFIISKIQEDKDDDEDVKDESITNENIK